MRRKANETFNDNYDSFRTHYESEKKDAFSQSAAYKLVKDSFIDGLDRIKNQAIKDLQLFVQQTLTAYTPELIRKHTEDKERALHKVEDDKKNTEKILEDITNLKVQAAALEAKIKPITALKGGIDSYLQ